MAQGAETVTTAPVRERLTRRLWLGAARAMRSSWAGLMLLLYLLGIAHGERAAIAVVGGLATFALLAGGAAMVIARYHARRSPVERPWMPWAVFCYGLASLSVAEKEEARARAEEVAARTLGATSWATLRRQGYLDVPSRLYPGTSYRVRPGRRIEILAAARCSTCDDGPAPPWGRHRYLCVFPRYDLPAVEFAAQCVLRLKSDESAVLQTGNFLPIDDAIYHVF